MTFNNDDIDQYTFLIGKQIRDNKMRLLGTVVGLECEIDHHGHSRVLANTDRNIKVPARNYRNSIPRSGV